ncbi:hypothetical protein QQF64_012129 [Cirrhinus molitorella]|uniref:Retrotransposon gag domain-containing protein n=1 Tax=Cirrhinus molitorella TaxID=172907 RepID=A0ABR3LXS9_9TELE
MSTDSRVLLAQALSHNESDDDESAPAAERREDATYANSTTRLLPFKVDLPQCFNGDDLVTILPTRLSGDALAYWLSLSPDIQQNYELCVAALNDVFGRKTFLLHFQSFVNARPRMPKEHLEVFAAEITRLDLEAFPKYGETAIAMERFRRFVAALDPVLQAKCHKHGATSLEEALAIACKWERAQEVLRLAPPHPLSQKTSKEAINSNKFSGERSSTDHLSSSGDHHVSFVDEDVDLQGIGW